MSPLDRAVRDFVFHGGAWLLFGWKVALCTFLAHFAFNLWRAKPWRQP